MTLTERKVDLVKRLFIETADDDYITARWAYSHAKQHVFFWHAAQSLEKIMKAALLLNDLSTHKYWHDIKKLWRKVQELDTDELISRSIPKLQSTALLNDAWEGFEVAEFIGLVNYFGSPDGRYGSLGVRQAGSLVQILDNLYFEIRIFIKTNNIAASDLYEIGGKDWTRSKNKTPPVWAIDDNLPLERLLLREYSVGDSDQLRSIFGAQNHSFFDLGDESAPQFGGLIEQGSPLYNHLVRMRTFKLHDADEIPQDNEQTIDELTAWADRTIKLPKELKEILAKARSG